jgi:putative ABC transport system substrate-binding protein
MRRREFIGLVGGMAAWPQSVNAQHVAQLRFPSAVASDDAFIRALQDLGYTEGQNVAFEYRYAGGHYDRLLDLAAELVHLRVDVIFTSWGTPTAVAAKKASQVLKETEAAANARGITLIAASARSPEELASALQLVLNENAAALIGGAIS